MAEPTKDIYSSLKVSTNAPVTADAPVVSSTPTAGRLLPMDPATPPVDWRIIDGSTQPSMATGPVSDLAARDMGNGLTRPLGPAANFISDVFTGQPIAEGAMRVIRTTPSATEKFYNLFTNGAYPIRRMLGFAEQGKRWLEAQGTNLWNTIDGKAFDSELQRGLALSVLTDEMTPDEAIKLGALVYTGGDVDWTIFGQALQLLRGEIPKNRTDEQQKLITTLDRGGSLTTDISEDTWWRTVTSEQTMDYLDSLAIVDFQALLSDDQKTQLPQLAKIAKQMDVSVADVARLTTFLFNDPLAADTYVDAARGIARIGSLRNKLKSLWAAGEATAEMVDDVVRKNVVPKGESPEKAYARAEKMKRTEARRQALREIHAAEIADKSQGGILKVLNKVAGHIAPDLQESVHLFRQYWTERSAAKINFYNHMMETDPKATLRSAEENTRLVDDFARNTFPNFAQWNSDIRFRAALSNAGIVRTDSPKLVRIYGELADAIKLGDQSAIRTKWLEADELTKQLDQADNWLSDDPPIMVALHTMIQDFEGDKFLQHSYAELTEDPTLIESLARYFATLPSPSPYDTRTDVSDLRRTAFAEALNASGLNEWAANAVRRVDFDPAEFMKRLRRMPQTPEALEELRLVMQNAQLVHTRYRAVWRRLRQGTSEYPGMSAEAARKRLAELSADMSIGLMSAREGFQQGTRSVSGASSIADLVDIDDNTLFRINVKRDPRVRDMLKAGRKSGYDPDSKSILLHPVDWFVGDMYFKKFLRKQGLQIRAAEVLMHDWMQETNQVLMPILERMLPRARDRILRTDGGRSSRRQLIGKMMSWSETLTPSEIIKYSSPSGVTLNPERIKLITLEANKPRLEKIKLLTQTRDQNILLEQMINADILKWDTAHPLDPEAWTGGKYKIGNRKVTIGSRQDWRHIIRDMGQIESDIKTESAQIINSPQAVRDFYAAQQMPMTFNLQAYLVDHPTAFDEVDSAGNVIHQEITDEDIQIVGKLNEFVDNLWSQYLLAQVARRQRFGRVDAKALESSSAPFKAMVESGQPTSRSLTALIAQLRNTTDYTQAVEDIPYDSVFFDARGTSTDIVDALKYATNHVNKEIHMREPLDGLEAIIMDAKGRGAYDEAAYTQLLANRLNGVPNFIDDSVRSTRAASIAHLPIKDEWKTWLLKHAPTGLELSQLQTRAIYNGALMLNTGFAFKNLFGTLNTGARFNRARTMSSLFQFFGDTKLLSGTDMAGSANLTAEVADYFMSATPRSKLYMKINGMTMGTETFNRGVSFMAAMDSEIERLVDLKLLKTGSMQEILDAGLLEHFTQLGMDGAFETQHIYGPSATPPFFAGGKLDPGGSKILNPLGQFISYVPKQMHAAWRMIADGEYSSFVRMVMLTGWTNRCLEAQGIDGSTFVGLTTGVPAGGSPALMGYLEMIGFFANVTTNMPQAKIHLDKWVRIMALTAAGAVGLGAVELTRLATAIRNENAGGKMTASGSLANVRGKREKVYDLIGIPTIQTAKSQALNARAQAYTAVKLSTIAGASRELLDLFKEAQENGLETADMKERRDELISMLTAEQWDPRPAIKSAREREAVDQPTSSLLDGKLGGLIAIRKEYGLLREWVKVSEHFLRKSMGDEKYVELRKALTGDTPYANDAAFALSQIDSTTHAERNKMWERREPEPTNPEEE